MGVEYHAHGNAFRQINKGIQNRNCEASLHWSYPNWLLRLRDFFQFHFISDFLSGKWISRFTTRHCKQYYRPSTCRFCSQLPDHCFCNSAVTLSLQQRQLVHNQTIIWAWRLKSRGKQPLNPQLINKQSKPYKLRQICPICSRSLVINIWEKNKFQNSRKKVGQETLQFAEQSAQRG